MSAGCQSHQNQHLMSRRCTTRPCSMATESSRSSRERMSKRTTFLLRPPCNLHPPPPPHLQLQATCQVGACIYWWYSGSPELCEEAPYYWAGLEQGGSVCVCVCSVHIVLHFLPFHISSLCLHISCLKVFGWSLLGCDCDQGILLLLIFTIP